MKKTIDLGPRFEYFGVLQTYVQQGLLEILPAANEAYITAAALYSLSYTSDIDKKVMEAEQAGNKRERQRLLAEQFHSLTKTTEDICIYSNFLNAAAEGFKQYQQASELAKDTPASSTAVRQADENMRKPQSVNRKKGTCFALHVVEDSNPHTLLYTIIITKTRHWFSPWRVSNEYELITY